MSRYANIVALSGGVGGAKLALGLNHVLAQNCLKVVCNTGDDFEHLGFPISPDLDTVMYTLAGLSNEHQGWGLADESWSFMQSLNILGGPTWFQLGDKDLATHTLRRHLLQSGFSLTEVTQKLCEKLQVGASLLPMTNSQVQTHIQTASETLPFQEYFVAKQCEPEVTGFNFKGVSEATLSPEVEAALNNADAIICCPSNPFVSIAPILAVPGFKAAVQDANVPVVVVSPIIAGAAIKGPAAKMMQELQLEVNNQSVAEYYQGFASHFVLDQGDAHEAQAIEALGYKTLSTQTLMQNLDDKTALANALLDWLKL